MTDIDENVDVNLQWNNYKLALATRMADSIVNGLAKSIKLLAIMLHQPQNKPMIKVKLKITTKSQIQSALV